MMEMNSFGRLPAGMTRTLVLQALQSTMKAARRSTRGSVSVIFISEVKMKALNRARRGIKDSTDVLSFVPAKLPIKFRTQVDWGDIIIAPAYVKRDAKHNSVPYRQQLMRVLVHGMLHLMGYDHANKRQEARMFCLQERVLKAIKA